MEQQPSSTYGKARLPRADRARMQTSFSTHTQTHVHGKATQPDCTTSKGTSKGTSSCGAASRQATSGSVKHTQTEQPHGSSNITKKRNKRSKTKKTNKLAASELSPPICMNAAPGSQRTGSTNLVEGSTQPKISLRNHALPF